MGPFDLTHRRPHSTRYGSKVAISLWQGWLAGAHRPLSARLGWILASLPTLPEGQGRAFGQHGRGIAGQPVHFLRRFSPSLFSFYFFSAVNEQNPSEALRWGGGPDN